MTRKVLPNWHFVRFIEPQLFLFTISFLFQSRAFPRVFACFTHAVTQPICRTFRGLGSASIHFSLLFLFIATMSKELRICKK